MSKTKLTDDVIKEVCEKEGYTFFSTGKASFPSGRSYRIINLKHNLCGKEYSVCVDKFVTMGQRCTCTRKQKYASIKNNSEFQHVLDERYGEGEYISVGKYLGSHKPVTIKHKCGYVYDVPSAGMMTRQETRCPICAKRKSRTYEELHQFLAKKGYNIEIVKDDFIINEKRNKYPTVINHDCGHTYQIDLNSYICDDIKKLCPICSKYHRSSYEDLIIEYIKSIYDGEIIPNYRIERQELDIYIPELSLGIEVNGLYWHSDKFKSSTYHVNKTKFFEERGIQVIQIFEDEMWDKKDIVLDKIHSVIKKMDNTVYARKCEIKNVTKKDKSEFLNANHIQGNDKSDINYGLYFENELVAIACFKKYKYRNNTSNKYGDNSYELSRFATKLNTNVIGGFSKLLEHFKRNNDWSSIVSYGDRRYVSSNKNMYIINGFELDHVTQPSYYYVRHLTRKSKYSYRKSKLAEGDFYDPTMTEQENMRMLGYKIIYDCGLLTYVLTKK